MGEIHRDFSKRVSFCRVPPPLPCKVPMLCHRRGSSRWRPPAGPAARAVARSGSAERNRLREKSHCHAVHFTGRLSSPSTSSSSGCVPADRAAQQPDPRQAGPAEHSPACNLRHRLAAERLLSLPSPSHTHRLTLVLHAHRHLHGMLQRRLQGEDTEGSCVL